VVAAGAGITIASPLVPVHHRGVEGLKLGCGACDQNLISEKKGGEGQLTTEPTLLVLARHITLPLVPVDPHGREGLLLVCGACTQKLMSE